MSSRKSNRRLTAFALWVLACSGTYIFLGLILVSRGFIAFVWPAYELVIHVFHADPSGFVVKISIAVFIGLIWIPLPIGIIRRKTELILLPFLILFANWFSGIMWGHV